MLDLKYKTSHQWVDAVLNNFDNFLLDHAACERKASSMAMSMVAHYPDKILVIEAMIDLAIEELQHYKAVVKIIMNKNIALIPDTKDSYVNQLRKKLRSGSAEYFMDRLILAGIIEARGYERFSLIAQHHPDAVMQEFYDGIARSEDKHQDLFIDLAKHYFDENLVEKRLEELLIIEADIVRKLPINSVLH